MRAVAVAVLLVAGLAGTAQAGRGTGLTRLLPEDVSMVVVADVSHGRGSDLMSLALSVANKHQPWWTKDVETSVETYLVAADGPIDVSAPSRHVYTIIDGKVGPLLDAWKGGHETTYGGVTYWSRNDVAGGEAAGEIAIVDKHLVLAPPGGMRGVIDRAHHKGASAATSANATTFRDALASAGTGTDVWGALVLDDSTRRSFQTALTADVTWVAFSIALATNASFDARFGAADADQAATLLAWLHQKLDDTSFKDGLAQLLGKGFVDSASLVQEHLTVRITGTMAGDEVAHFSQVLNSWL